MCFSSYLLPISFLPGFAENKGISKITIGLILSFYPIGATVASVILSKYMSLLGKLKLIYYLTYIYCMSMMLFATGFWMKS